MRFKQIIKKRPVLIGLHVLAWVCFLFMPFFIYRIQILHKGFFLKELIDNLFLIGIFYLNIYVLIPRFFNGKKIAVYITSIGVVLVLITMQQAALDYYFFRNFFPRAFAVRVDKKIRGEVTSFDARPLHHRNHLFVSRDDIPPPEPMTDVNVAHTSSGTVVIQQGSNLRHNGIAVAAPELFEKPPFLEYLFFPEVLRRSGFFALLMLFMSGFIKIALEWFKSEKQREELKVEKLDAELKFLKSQINPHFLFNCLNTIYSLAHKRSTQTEHAILKLSTIMRYMIYESNEAKVRLSQELKYLEDYIDIQRLRLSKDIPIQYRVSGEPEGLLIEPMLLVPFVENAFKHGISYTEDSFIAIDIAISENMIRLTVRNSHFKERVAERGGIGLQNVLKRLEMLYAGEHEVSIQETENQFIVDLKLVLKK
ncbi:sensor histidine kinase [Chitinophaga vietnamensis]|uniref:sensor histidine kinase n=1 Tax=Chitinophaga vietnamensis TaxID=2593957 RepID=UPI00117889B1|nr:histidine kinase [Chitinophaga vietnamensis]